MPKRHHQAASSLSTSAPRSLSSVILEQGAGFFGLSAPVQPGMDEGLGFHQDGTTQGGRRERFRAFGRRLYAFGLGQ
jgi:hypothetical protein